MNSSNMQNSYISSDKISRPLNIGIAGLGTVGCGIVKLLEHNADLIKQRSHTNIYIHSVMVRNPQKARDIDLLKYNMVTHVEELLENPDINLIIEVIGGDGDPAYSLVKSALKAKKAVITANKALLAKHGLELAQIAENNDTPLLFEAAVAGGIPIVKLLREGLAGNRIKKILGIMNGTSNYILSTMEMTGASFATVLKEAQELGYAESDPLLDIGGGDAAHKLALLSSLAFGCVPDFDQITLMGIERINQDDIQIAAEFKYRIKLVAQAELLNDGRVLQMVVPTLVPYALPLAHVNGVMNGIYTYGDFVGPSFIEGRGAGAGPTASAILSDVMDLAHQIQNPDNGRVRPVFGIVARALSKGQTTGGFEWFGRYYMRLTVMDRPGVIAEIAPILRDHLVSIESLIQRGRSEDLPVNIIIITHATRGKNIAEVIFKLKQLPVILDTPMVMPILDTEG